MTGIGKLEHDNFVCCGGLNGGERYDRVVFEIEIDGGGKSIVHPLNYNNCYPQIKVNPERPLPYRTIV